MPQVEIYRSYPAFAGQQFNQFHQFAAGPASLLVLLVPLLLVLFLIGLLSRLSDAREKRPRPAPPARAVTPAAISTAPMRASDHEREETARVVSHAMGEGRLSLDEGRQRIDAAFRARHRHELAAIVADLPPAPPAPRSRGLAAAPRRLGLLGAAAAIVLVAILVQALTGLWELWPVAVTALGVAALLRPRR